MQLGRMIESAYCGLLVVLLYNAAMPKATAARPSGDSGAPSAQPSTIALASRAIPKVAIHDPTAPGIPGA